MNANPKISRTFAVLFVKAEIAKPSVEVTCTSNNAVVIS